MRTVDDSFREMMEGYGLTTVKIFYHRPDARSLLNEFTLQFYDLHPRFPRLHYFLEFWRESIDGPINSIIVAHKQLITPSEIRMVDNEHFLN